MGNKTHPDNRVNEDDRWRGVTKGRLKDIIATLSILSEGEFFCDGCGRRIDGKAVYMTGRRPGYHENHSLEIIALMHPSCYGWKDE